MISFGTHAGFRLYPRQRREDSCFPCGWLQNASMKMEMGSINAHHMVHI